MARKYNRDNRGRFASGGGGATARGGRLRTASGGKRATQTMTAKAGGPRGTIRKPAPANNAPMTPKDRQSMAAVKRGKAGKPNAEDKMIQDAMARRGVNARLGQPMQTKATAAQRKKALIRDASAKVLAGRGKEVGAARRNYIRSQQEESLRMEKTGKGSKAARRMAKRGK